MKNKNFGMRVDITFKKDSPFKEITEDYRNVTEIHYCYPSHMEKKRVAFESDIHGTGVTQPISYIKEFETILETEKAKRF